MKNQTIGVEIEFTGITRRDAINVIAKILNTQGRFAGGAYGTFVAVDSQGRQWKVVRDCSIRTQGVPMTVSDDEEYKCELVTPILKYEDIDLLQEMVRGLRKAKAVVNYSCGIHVHLGAKDHTARTLKNLTNIMASKENLIYRALQVGGDRESYCKKTEQRFLKDINQKSVDSIEAVRKIWYGGNDEAHMHYSNTRYHGLNLHSVFSKGTVEFRMFNSTLHAGKVKSYIQLCLAINNQAMTQRCASCRITETSNDKFTFRTWLLRMGMLGDEFKTARHHLLSNLSGNSAWRYAA